MNIKAYAIKNGWMEDSGDQFCAKGDIYEANMVFSPFTKRKIFYVEDLLFITEQRVHGFSEDFFYDHFIELDSRTYLKPFEAYLQANETKSRGWLVFSENGSILGAIYHLHNGSFQSTPEASAAIERFNTANEAYKHILICKRIMSWSTGFCERDK